jgi:hypothetical protein
MCFYIEQNQILRGGNNKILFQKSVYADAMSTTENKSLPKKVKSASSFMQSNKQKYSETFGHMTKIKRIWYQSLPPRH